MKHSPTIRLAQAKATLERAYIDCPHWDYESDGYTDHTCCDAVLDAKREVNLARKAVGNASR